MGDKRFDALDAFRGVAILSVMSFHYLVRWAPPLHARNLYGYEISFPGVFDNGYLGVHLFFVISGIVITMTVQRSRDAFEFCARRLARLCPAFFVAMPLTFAVTWLVGIPEFGTNLGDLLANFSMIPGDLHHKAVDGVYWSLAVEIKFYGYVALAYATFRQRFWLAIIALSVLGTLAGAAGHSGFADHWLIAKWMPLFLAGMGTWFLIFEKATTKGSVLYAVATVLYVFEAMKYVTDGATPISANVFLLTAVALMLVLLWRRPFWRLGPLARVGRISYSLYLVHQFIGVIIIRYLVSIGIPDIASAAIAAVSCVALAATMYEEIERRWQRKVLGAYHWMRQRYFPRMVVT